MITDASIQEIDGVFYCYATTDGYGKGLETSVSSVELGLESSPTAIKEPNTLVAFIFYFINVVLP